MTFRRGGQGGEGPKDDGNEAFEAFYRQEAAGLRMFFVRKRLTPELAEELTQETFLRVYKVWAGISSVRSPQAWLTEIARNILKNHYRGQATAKRDGEAVSLEEASTSLHAVERHQSSLGLERQDDQVEQKEQLEALSAAVRRLPRRQRRVVLLKAQGFSYREMAELEGVAVETIKSHLKLGRARLLALLGDDKGGSR